MAIASERHEEFSPGLDPELLALIQTTYRETGMSEKPSEDPEFNADQRKKPGNGDRGFDTRDTDHPTGTEQAAGNAANESPSWTGGRAAVTRKAVSGGGLRVLLHQ